MADPAYSESKLSFALLGDDVLTRTDHVDEIAAIYVADFE
jgi:hypothetical protein